jgi:hypothetical protein
VRLGAVLALGVFARFTFVAFALPVLVHEMRRVVLPPGYDTNKGGGSPVQGQRGDEGD